jgi:RecA-family ATPase
MTMQPDRDQIELFVDGLFRHAGPQGFVSMRAFFEDDAAKPFRIGAAGLSGGLGFLVDVAEDDATRAANAPKPVVFCPPIAVFADKDRARERDIVEGLALSVECDQHPHEARARLEGILGPATMVVRSGGRWTDQATGEIHDKLHLHWRLRTPAKGEHLVSLKRARDMAARLVGGDPSNKPICHPIRWPGSWHRKGEPILCSIETASPDREIDLAAALVALGQVCPPEASRANGKDHGASEDWAPLIKGVLTAENYHAALVTLAAKMLVAGMSDGAAVNLLRGLMESSIGPRNDRWEVRYGDIPRAVSTAREKFGGDTPPPEAGAGEKPDQLLPLPYINMSKWDEEPVPEQRWGVLNRFPLHQAAVFSGEGAGGKSTLALQLGVAHVLGRDWLGTMPELGPAIVIDAEDDPDVMHRRLALIRDHYRYTSGTDEEIGFKKLIGDGLHPVSLINEDATIATASRSGKIEPTTLYKRLLKDAGEIKPKLISIASSANVYAGSEIDRSQVQQFAALLTRLAIAADGYLILIAHPSLTGITTDTGLSGTTQWHNAFRARAYLKSIKPEAGEQPDNDLRELVFKKNQYGRIEESIVLRYQNGLYLPVPGMASLDRAAHESQADDVFVTLLRRFTKENRFVGSTKSVIYAPSVFSKEDEAKRGGITAKMLENAMMRLFKSGKVWNDNHGRLSRPRYHLALKT